MEANTTQTTPQVKTPKKTLKLKVLVLPKMLKFILSFEYGTLIGKIKNKIEKILNNMKVTSHCDKLTNEEDYILLEDSRVEDVLNNEDKIIYYTKIQSQKPQQQLLNKKREHENHKQKNNNAHKENTQKPKAEVKVEENSEVSQASNDSESNRTEEKEYKKDKNKGNSHKYEKIPEPTNKIYSSSNKNGSSHKKKEKAN